MGFRLNRTYKLRFDGALEGLEVDLRATSVGTLAVMSDADAAGLADLLEQHVERWNYEDQDGNPIPATAENFLGLEEVVLTAICREWFKAAKGITAPLESGSTSGSTLPEESIPMETL